MIDYIKLIEQEQLRTDLPPIAIGDYVRVHLKVKEGNRERIQVFEGTIIARKSGGLKETITVRRLSYGVGVERVLPLHSPRISKIEIVRRGKIRRAKLYYLRKRIGKAARVKERLVNRELLKAKAAAAAEAAEQTEIAEAAPETIADTVQAETAPAEDMSDTTAEEATGAREATGAPGAREATEATEMLEAETQAEEEQVEEAPADSEPEAETQAAMHSVRLCSNSRAV